MLFFMCPGQKNQIWSTLCKAPILLESPAWDFNNYSMIIDALVKVHNEAKSSQTKRRILSLFANDFSCAELQQIIPSLSKWRIDQTQQQVIHTGQGQPIPEQPIFHSKIDAAKVDHLLNFITHPDFLQEVAFGTKKLKLDSGEHDSLSYYQAVCCLWQVRVIHPSK